MLMFPHRTEDSEDNAIQQFEHKHFTGQAHVGGHKDIHHQNARVL